MSVRLIEHFDLVAGSEGGVGKLRELILSLAVKGMLVPQDPADEPASVLLESIRKEKLKLIKEGRIKPEKALASVSEDEQFSVLPGGWEWVRLGTITNFGSTTKAEEIGDDTWVLDLEDIEKGSSRLLQKVRQSERAALSVKSKFNAGDVLYGKLRPYLNKVIVADEPGVCTTEIVPLHCYGPFDPNFFRAVLQSPYFLAYVNSKSYGVKMPRLGTDDGRQAPIPLPPLAEQSRIVTKINELMAICDRLESEHSHATRIHDHWVDAALDQLAESADADEFSRNWQHLHNHWDQLFTTPKSVDRLEATLLKLAVRGKIVPQDLRDEPASELLKQVRAEKERLIAEGKIKSAKALPPVGLHERRHDLPRGWEWARFGEVSINRDGERVPVSSAEREKRAKLYDYYGASGVIDKIDGFLFDKTLLLIGEDGANLLNRATPIAFLAHGRYWVNNHAHVVDATNPDLLSYLCLFINATSLEPYVTGTAQPKMNQAKLNGIVTAVPPLAEQSRIVAKVAALMAVTADLRSRLAGARTKRAHLAEVLIDEVVA